MYQSIKNKLLLIYILILLGNSLLAQNPDTLRGRILDQYTGLPLPFIELKTNTHQTISDIEGRFILPIVPLENIIIDDPDFSFFNYKVDTVFNHEYIFSLIRVKKKRFKQKEQKKQRDELDSIFTINRQNSIYRNNSFSYFTYNKIKVHTDNEEQNYNLLNYIKKYVPKKYLNFKYDPKHRIFLMETYTQKKYKSKLFQKEYIHKNNVTGVSRSTLFSFSSDFQQTSVYDKYLLFNFTNYSNPLNKKSYKRYNYYISDTVIINNRPKTIVKFYPKNKNLFDAIQGTFVWDITDKYTEYLHVIPYREDNIFTQLTQEYKKDSATNHFIPIVTETTIRSTTLDHKNIIINAQATTYLKNYKRDSSFSKSHFDENAYEYDENYNPTYDTTTWDKLRTEQLNTLDSNTFKFYNNIGHIKNLEKLINIGKDIYMGKIAIGKQNVLLNKIINYNKVEGTRLGLGAESNDSLSKKHYLMGYWGHGFYDKKNKYGSTLGIKIEEKANLWAKVSYTKDLSEPGRTDLLFDKQQYSSESFRKYQLQLLDEVRKFTFTTQCVPIRYTNLALIFTNETTKPLYLYRYQNSQFNFHFREISMVCNVAFGRQFIKYADHQLFLKDRYPVLTLQITNSLPGQNSSFEYTKYDLKLTYNFWLLGKGQHNIQAHLGLLNGSAPYFKLYNSKGSFSNLYTTINNSFETMNYNEFCSNKYASIFYLVNFGRLNRIGKFKPSLTIAHNMGWGSLNNLADHSDITFKTMNNGYFESGFTVGDILRYNLYGLKMGLGLSMYCRYGYYRYKNTADNFVVKLATSFRI